MKRQKKLKDIRNELMKDEFRRMKKEGFRTEFILNHLSRYYFLKPSSIRRNLQPLKHI